jgi:hypothetical protein
MYLLPLFEWMERHAPLREWWPYVGPAFNLVHLLGMVVFAGALLMVDLRLLGGILTRRPVAAVARDAQPWLLGGLAALVATGIPALMATSLGQYYNPVFWFKMQVLFVGAVFTFTIRRHIIFSEDGRVGRGWMKLVGALSLTLWAAVAASARLIMLI